MLRRAPRERSFLRAKGRGGFHAVMYRCRNLLLCFVERTGGTRTHRAPSCDRHEIMIENGTMTYRVVSRKRTVAYTPTGLVVLLLPSALA